MNEIKKQEADSYKSESLMAKRLRKFKSIKRGYYSFIIIVVLYAVSFFCPLLMNYKALVVKYDGKYSFPIFKYNSAESYHQDIQGDMLFKTEYLKQPGLLLAKIIYGSDEATDYISKQLTPETSAMASQYLSKLNSNDKLRAAIGDELAKLNQIDVNFIDEEFTEVEFNEVTRNLKTMLDQGLPNAEFIPFAIKTLDDKEPVYKFIKRQFAYGSKVLLKDYFKQSPMPDEIKSALVSEFRQILRDDSLYTEQRFASVKMNIETVGMQKQNPQGKDAIRFNRMLLSDAFPEELEIKRIYGEADYRLLDRQLEEEAKGNWVLMPVFPYGPYESMLVPDEEPPNAPSKDHWFGTDDRGRDVFVRLAYGFNVSISFALSVLFISYIIGVSIGASLGYFGGKYDIIVQRFIEVWAGLPFLYTVMIISSLIQPTFLLLVGILVLVRWMGMTYFMRGEFYREKARDYVHAAISMGASDFTIVFKHIMPNALTPVITFAPFGVISLIGALVGLDYLGFGLPPPTASWGEMIRQGMANIFSWWMVLFTFSLLFITLLLVVFVGEAVREAFDPRTFSRLR
ncbi:MAG: ABC transporter permease subunit [Calditrichaeota bacterium]|nr:ABC transporter permease subunit [Calditrichota bacterium]